MSGITEIHVIHRGIVVILDVLLKRWQQGVFIIHQQGVRHFQRDVQIYRRKLFQQGFAILIQRINAVRTIAQEVDDFLKGLSAGAIGRHGQGILEAERGANHVFTLVKLPQETEGHRISCFDISFLGVAKTHFGDLFGRRRRRYGKRLLDDDRTILL